MPCVKSVAGVGSSPVVGYEGTEGIYCKLEDGIWRLEVMPDVVRASDPFAKPSLNKDVGRLRRAWDMALSLPDLGKALVYELIWVIRQVKNWQRDHSFVDAGVYCQKEGLFRAKHGRVKLFGEPFG
jgi:hypothetical protein